MNVKIFLDTNVLVYAYDRHEPAKQEKAQSILREAIQKEIGSLSVQVLGEFFTVVTRRIKRPLSADQAEEIIERLSVLPVQEIDLPVVRRAIDIQKKYQISYWDCLILAAAERAGCGEVRSEDLKDGQVYDGVRVVNPFRP